MAWCLPEHRVWLDRLVEGADDVRLRKPLAWVQSHWPDMLPPGWTQDDGCTPSTCPGGPWRTRANGKPMATRNRKHDGRLSFPAVVP